MNWLYGALYFLAFAGLGWMIHRTIHGSSPGITPLGVFSAVWALAAWLYIANPFGLYRLSESALWTIILAIFSYIAGYGSLVVVARTRQPSNQNCGNKHTIDENWDAVASLWRLCRAAWLSLFALYIFQIHAYATSSLSGLLLTLRTDLDSGGSPPLGFYYFYFAQISVPLGTVLYLKSHRRRYLLWTIFAAAALVLTSGRSNVLAAVAAAAFIVMLRGPVRLNRRRTATAVVSLLVLLGLFNLLGNSIGKTYQNSQLYADFGNHPPVATWLAQPLFYVAGTVPYFGEIVRTEPSGGTDHGANTMRPFLQLTALGIPSVTAPAKIQEFRDIPYATNLGTYLSPLYRDFGAVGVSIGSTMFGFFSALAWLAWRRRGSPFSLAVLGVVLIFNAGSILDAGFTELWFLLFLALVALYSRKTIEAGYVRRASATGPRRC